MDIQALLPAASNPKIQAFRSGDTVRVSLHVIEGNRERTQTLEGVVIRQHRGGAGSTFTIRRVTRGIGMELTYLFHSPRLEAVQVMRRGRVRRARLYYLRGRFGKAARIKEAQRMIPGGQLFQGGQAATEEAEAPEAETVEEAVGPQQDA
ncbi:MAG: 50S ribosomal protein L19 [Chloroflexi bacterium]|nr:50S ribosomal protein L19 [Chloroflexota bacterium]